MNMAMAETVTNASAAPALTSSMMAAEPSLAQVCSEVGLSCESCTRETARSLAAVCKGLRGKAVSQLFVQLYPNSACSAMHSNFTACYQEASVELNRVNIEEVEDFELAAPRKSAQPSYERREVMYARPRTMAACA